MTNKTVSITMPDWVWGRLVMIADKGGVTVGDLIASTLRTAIDASPLVRPVRYVQAPKASRSIQELIDEATAAQDRAGLLALEVKAAQADGYRSPKYEQRARSTAKARGKK